MYTCDAAAAAMYFLGVDVSCALVLDCSEAEGTREERERRWPS